MPFRALAPQASASAYSATRTRLPVAETRLARPRNYTTAPRLRPRNRKRGAGWTGDRAEHEPPARAAPGRRGGGGRARARPHPHRHQQLRRRHAAPARPRRRSTSRSACARSATTPSVFTCGQPGRDGVVVRIPGRDRTRGALLLHGHLDVVPAARGRLDAAAVRRRDRRRPRRAHDLGPRRRRHEGHGAMIAGDRARSWARNGVQPERDVVAHVPARRGGRRAHRLALAGREPAGPVRGRDRGGRRGRRLLDDRPRRPAALPRADRREGHRLAAADGRGTRRATARCSTTTTPSRRCARPWRGSARSTSRCT